ncbi:hypothetical protein Gasu2_45600 [Galdieria sulphuraria]|uniref:Uncharacterized protein n=1 Tax=Galdieria sulphuraria TaxID=130081 RepID=M2XNY3_GALSU|nr:uncharacterized protein Gasu_09340 [Galdieria sulphuraria]EME31862.1 hypothetical protein Gasu_09340 [Galdieria sulphuraria]GJD10366.1 hypothetical protein Gasu2_45600 [Galdieria sulphuraria]|eukprot:XP_005708382.1 hypothetical protein Gasu_09340 [Galdieria sulphuraria]
MALSCSLQGPPEGSIENLINTISRDVTTLQSYMQRRKEEYDCILKTCPVCGAVEEYAFSTVSPTATFEQLNPENRILYELQQINEQRRTLYEDIVSVQQKPECELCLLCALHESAFECGATPTANSFTSQVQSQHTQQQQTPVFSESVVPRPTILSNKTRVFVV